MELHAVNSVQHSLTVAEDQTILVPAELVSQAGFEPGTPMYWHSQPDGSFVITDHHEKPGTRRARRARKPKVANVTREETSIKEKDAA